MTPKLPIQTISDWPGGGDRGERKVPTALVYNANNTISSWGFLCADDDTTLPRKTRCEFLKLSLDAETLAGAHAQGIRVPRPPRSKRSGSRPITSRRCSGTSRGVSNASWGGST